MIEKRTFAALAISFAAALWGFDGVVLTPRLAPLPVLFVVFLLHAVPFVLMQPVLGRSWGRLRRLPPRELGTLALVSAVGGVIGTLAIVRALFLVNFDQLSVVVLLQKLQPVFAILLAAMLLGERMTARFLIWAAVAVTGGYLLTFGLGGPVVAGDGRTTQAALWAVVAAASFGAATVLGKKLLGSLDFWTATFGRYGMTTAITGTALAVTGAGFPFAEVTRAHWLLVLLIGLTTGTGAIALYYWGLTRVRAVTATICELSLPLSAVVFDYFVNGSRLGPVQWLGGALLIGAITRVTLKGNRAS